MDLVSRLKTYMNHINLTNSQFADACRIPRPSLSQLLSGRNKKVSDEIISKIHESFPGLSILWLMFGEGNMETDSNIKISELQNRQNTNTLFGHATENQNNTTSESDFYNSTTFSSENFKTDINDGSELFDHKNITDIGSKADQSQKPHIDLNTKSGKRITNIVVFYDDNSFDSFEPS